MEKFKEVIDKGFTQNYLSGDINDIRKSLADYGVDLVQNAERQDKLVKQLKFKLKASISKERDNELLKMAESFKDALVKGLDRPVAYLNNLIRENQVIVQYKNLEKLSTDEIKEIIKDQNLIEIIELLENEQ